MADEVRFSLILDAHGKPFVTDVQRAMGEVETAAEKTGARTRKSFGDVISTGVLLRLAGAAYAMKRLADAADEPSERLRLLKGDAHEAAATIGNELQAAMGQIGMAARPMIKGFTDADGAVHGLALGFAGAVLFGRPLIGMLKMMGVAAGPVGWALLAVSLIAGAVLGKMGKDAQDAEEKLRGFREEVARMNATEATAEVERLRAKLVDLGREIAALRIERLQSIDLDVKWHIQRPPRSDVEKQLAEEQKTAEASLEIAKAHEADLAKLQAEAAKRAGQIGALKVEPAKRSGEIISEINAQIALGKKRLSEAREEIEAEQLKAEKRLADLRAGGELMMAAFLPEQKKAFDETKIAADAEQVRLAAVKQAQGDVNSLLSARGDLTRRIGEQSEKERSEAYHRKLLIAETLDILKGEEPVNQQRVAAGEYAKLIAEGHVETEIHMLELKKSILGFEGEITTAVQRRAEAADEAVEKAEAEYRQLLMQEQATRRLIELSVMRLEAAGESDFRRKRLAQLQEELGLTVLTVGAIREKARALDEIESGFVGPMSPEQLELQQQSLDAQRDGLKELLTLMQSNRDAAQDLARQTWEPFRRAVEETSRAAARAMVELFTRGKASAKQFADDMVRIFEQMLMEMLSKEILKFLISIFLSLFSGGAGAGLGAMAGELLHITSRPGGGAEMPPDIPELSRGLDEAIATLKNVQRQAAGGDWGPELVRTMEGIRDSLRDLGERAQGTKIRTDLPTLEAGLERIVTAVKGLGDQPRALPSSEITGALKGIGTTLEGLQGRIGELKATGGEDTRESERAMAAALIDVAGRIKKIGRMTTRRYDKIEAGIQRPLAKAIWNAAERDWDGVQQNVQRAVEGLREIAQQESLREAGRRVSRELDVFAYNLRTAQARIYMAAAERLPMRATGLPEVNLMYLGERMAHRWTPNIVLPSPVAQIPRELWDRFEGMERRIGEMTSAVDRLAASEFRVTPFELKGHTLRAVLRREEVAAKRRKL